MKMNPTLSLEVKEAIDLAVQSASDHFGELLRSLARDLAKERSRSKQLAQQIAELKSKLQSKSTPTPSHKSTPKLPAGFKYSPDLQTKRNEHAAQQAVLQVLEARELATYEQRTLATIAERNKKIVAEMEYAKALKSDYASAMRAVNNRKAAVEINGQTIITDYSGTTAKAELDLENNKLFTFERLASPSFEYQGKEYKLIHAELSPINAGNVYYFQKSN
ncbi:MAG: hypothetical protein FIA89_10695 [Geobacter sp.]|nr:hypothetical protein [Geobacter sp.]